MDNTNDSMKLVLIAITCEKLVVLVFVFKNKYKNILKRMYGLSKFGLMKSG